MATDPRTTDRSASPDAGLPGVLHVVAPDTVGGLERVVQAAATGGRARGHEHHVAAILEPGRAAGHPWLADLRDAGIPVHPLAVGQRAYRREAAAVRLLCRRLGIGIVHTHGFRPDVVDAAAGRAAGCATVSTVHGFTGGGLRVRLYEHVQRRALRRGDAVVAVSRPLLRDLAAHGVPRGRLHLLPNPLPDPPPAMSDGAQRRAMLDIPAGHAHVGWIGRMTREKGLDVLLAALGHLNGRPLTVSLIGDGPERRRLEPTTGPDVRWHGAVPWAAGWMPAFDVVVLSSRTEGTPLVLLEALTAGVPVVATAVGGVPDVVGRHGALLVPPEDPAALARAIQTVLDQPEPARRRTRRAAERLARTHGMAGWLEGMARIYRSALAAHRR